MKRMLALLLIVGVALAGCKSPDDRLPPISEDFNRIVIFQFDIFDVQYNEVTRPATFTVTALDSTNQPTTFTSEGVTYTGFYTFPTTFHTIAIPLILDVTTVEVVVQADVLVERGDAMNCWVERAGEQLFSTERTYIAAGEIILHGTCSYTVGMPA